MREPIQLVDLAQGTTVAAELFDEVTLDHFIQTQQQWRPMVVEATRRMVLRGVKPELQPTHWHWNWEDKNQQLGRFGLSFYGVECCNELQGLMKLDLARYTARIPTQEGAELAYVDYIEVAPWNHREIADELEIVPKYRTVGANLFAAAVLLSKQIGYEGRVALHSLPHPNPNSSIRRPARWFRSNVIR